MMPDICFYSGFAVSAEASLTGFSRGGAAVAFLPGKMHKTALS